MATRKAKAPAPAVQAPLIPEVAPEWFPVTIRLDNLPASDQLLGEPSPEFTESVRRFGVMQPVALLYKGNGDGPSVNDGPEMWDPIDGRRRIKAQRLAGREFIPAIYTVDRGMFSRHTLVMSANALRSDNLATDFEALEVMMSRGETPESIAAATGIGVPAIKAKIAMLQGLHSYHRGLLKSGDISQNIAEGLSKLQAGTQERIARDHKAAKGELRITHETVKAGRAAERESAQASAPRMAIDDAPATFEALAGGLLASVAGALPADHPRHDQILALLEELAQAIEPEAVAAPVS